MLERVRRWVESLPAVERDLPVINYAGRDWTPNAILREVEAGTPTGRELQRRLEHRVIGQVNIRALAKRRLLKLLEKYPVEARTLSLKRPVIRPEELKREIETEGALGRSLIDVEIGKITQTLGKY